MNIQVSASILLVIVVLTSSLIGLGRPGELSLNMLRVRGCSCKLISQAGNQIGETFWKMLLAEHGLDDAGVRNFSGAQPSCILTCYLFRCT